jgi:hypothetical protein
MKLLQCLFCLLLLAVIALADPAPLFCRGLASNYTTNSTYPEPRKYTSARFTMRLTATAPGALVWDYAEMMSRPEPEDRFANLTVPAAAAGASKDLAGANLPIIRMSSNKQHIAEYTHQRMWDMIHEALVAICPLERGAIGCYPGMPGSGKPYDDGTLPPGDVYKSMVRINGVPYQDSQGRYANNAWITVTATGIFRDQKYPGIGAALVCQPLVKQRIILTSVQYEMAAGVYKEATEAEFNCYHPLFSRPSRPYRFCVVPHHILIAFPANKDQIIDAWLQVTVEFNGETTVGNLDCDQMTDPSGNITTFWKAAVLPDVTQAMGNSADDWTDPCLECFSEDEAFTLDSWRSSQHCNARFKAGE